MEARVTKLEMAKLVTMVLYHMTSLPDEKNRTVKRLMTWKAEDLMSQYKLAQKIKSDWDGRG